MHSNLLLPTLTLTLLLLVNGTNPTPLPPLRRLGQHAPPSTEQIDVIQSTDFTSALLHTYQQHNYPLVIRRAVRQWPAYTHWTSETAMLQRLPVNYTMRVELSSKEDPSRAYTSPESWLDSSNNMSVKEFIQKYDTEGWYSAIDLPRALYKDVALPEPLHTLLSFADTKDHIENIENIKNTDATTTPPTLPKSTAQFQHFINKLNVSPRLWWSKGGTRSSLHYDPYDNLHCMVSGAKLFVLFPPRHISKTHISDAAYFNSNENSEKYEFYTNREVSLVDVDAVDLAQYPGFSNASFSVVKLKPGDCLFLPYFWMHSVRSIRSKKSRVKSIKSTTAVAPPPNIAVSFWWDSWTTLLGLKWIGGLSTPTVSPSGDYIVGDTERLFLEFDDARRQKVAPSTTVPLKKESLFSYLAASGQSIKSPPTTRSSTEPPLQKTETTRKKRATNSRTPQETARKAAKEATAMLASSWSKFIPIFMKSRFKKSSILHKYPVVDQRTAAMALVWIYPELPRLVQLIQARGKHTRKQRGALAVSSTRLWLERQLCLLLGDFRGAFTATRRLKKRQPQPQHVDVAPFSLATDVVHMMDELSDMLVRGNVANVLAAAQYSVAKNSVAQWERNCGQGTATTAVGDARIVRTTLTNDVVCRCVEKSGLFQQTVLRTAIVSGTPSQLAGLLWSTLSSDYNCFTEYVVATVGEVRAREAIHSTLVFTATAVAGRGSNARLGVFSAATTVFNRTLGMGVQGLAAGQRILKLGRVADLRAAEITVLGGSGEVAGAVPVSLEGRNGTETGSADVTGRVAVEQVNYDGGWNVEQQELGEKKDEPSLFTWSNRCDIAVLSSWSTDTLYRHYQTGTPVLLLDAASLYMDTTLRYLFTRESIADNLGEETVYPVLIPNEDALLFECDGPACYRPEDRSENSMGGSEKECSRASQTLDTYLSTCYRPEQGAGTSPRRTKSQIIDDVPKYMGNLVNEAEQSMFGKEKKVQVAGSGDDAATPSQRASPLMYSMGPRGSGDAVTFSTAHEWSALLYGRKRWYLYRPVDAFATRMPILEWLDQQEGGGGGGEKDERVMLCEQPANSVLLVPKGWSRGSLHLTDSIGVFGKLQFEQL